MNKDKVSDLHARVYAEFIHLRREALKGEKQKEVLEEIGSEIENLRAAWNWAVERGMEQEILELSEPLALFYEIQGWLREGEEMFGYATEKVKVSGNPRIVARTLTAQGKFCSLFGFEFRRKAEGLLREALAIYDNLDDQRGKAKCLNLLAFVCLNQREFGKAKELSQSAFAIWEIMKDRRGMAQSLKDLGSAAYSLGDFSTARDLNRRSLDIYREIGDVREVALSSGHLGIIANCLGEHPEAKALGQDALKIFKEMKHPQGIAMSLLQLGLTFQEMGDYGEAKQRYQEALQIYRDLGRRDAIGDILGRLGEVSEALGEITDAKKRYSEAISVALQTFNLLEALEILTRMASILAKEGAKEEALEILVFIFDQPALVEETAIRGKSLLTELEAQVSPEVIASVRDKMKSCKIEDVAEKALKDMEE